MLQGEGENGEGEDCYTFRYVNIVYVYSKENVGRCC